MILFYSNSILAARLESPEELLKNNGTVFKILQKEGGRKPGGDGGWTEMAEWG